MTDKTGYIELYQDPPGQFNAVLVHTPYICGYGKTWLEATCKLIDSERIYRELRSGAYEGNCDGRE